LPQDFATALVKKLWLGIEYMTKAEYPAQGADPNKKQPAPVNSEGGNEAKHQRHEE
jgi:hypothetical protein